MLERRIGVHRQLDLILPELFPEGFPHDGNYALERSLIQRRIIDHIDDAEEIARRFRREVVPEVHRNTQHDRELLVPHRHLPQRRLNEQRCAQFCHRRVPLSRRRQKCRHRNRPLKQMILQVLIPVAAQMISPHRRVFLPFRLFLFLLVILSERVVLPVTPRRSADCHLQLGEIVPDSAILCQDRLEEFKGPCPVRQNMEHLQVDPAPVIVDPVEEVSSPLAVDRVQGRPVVRRHFRLQIALIEIVPEHALFQNTAEMRELPRRGCHGSLQDLRVHFLLELAGDPENSGIGSACRGGHYFGGVIQLIPLSLCQFSSPVMDLIQPQTVRAGTVSETHNRLRPLPRRLSFRSRARSPYFWRNRKGSSSTRKCIS